MVSASNIKQQGFTLLEVLIASGIALVLGTSMLSILTTNTGLFYKQRAAITSGLGLNDAMSLTTDTIKQASAVVTGYPLITPTYTSSATTVVLQLQSYNAAGIIDNTYDYAVITKDAAKPQILKLLVFADVASLRSSDSRILTGILDTVNFKYQDLAGTTVAATAAKQIEVSVTTTSSTGALKSKPTAITTVSLNNVQN